MRQLFLLLLFLSLSKLKAQSKDSIIEVVSNHLPTIFYCNGKPCSGSKEGYYNDSNFMLKGRFRNGKANGRVFTYSSTGILVSKRLFKKGKIREALSYDTLGRLIRDLNWEKEISTTYYYDSQGQNLKKEVFTWKNVGWENGVTEVYEKKDNIWVKVPNRS